MRLEEIHSPEDVRRLKSEELPELSSALRETIIRTVARQGGHLASNLGVVEATIALHRVFHMPEDKIIFDVGHQSYVHKLITGRYGLFQTLRSFGGLSGFPKRSESPYDVFETGHASTALSAALGMARARDLLHQKHHVVAFVGDGALTGGMCYEALNDAGNSQTCMMVILNDNEMSISPNVGALSRYLTELRVSRGWQGTKHAVRKGTSRIPLIGPGIYRLIHWAKKTIKSIFIEEGFFEALGFKYFGPIDGHDIELMERTMTLAKEVDGPTVVHILTKKGLGYGKAEERPETFHGLPPQSNDEDSQQQFSSAVSFGKAAVEELIRLAENDNRIVGITAAMPTGTGLQAFQKRFPSRMLDVGIAEEHAVTMAAGLAAGGMKPYFMVYATFFQRAYDQLIHDVSMQHLPVTFLIDRAGLVGEDGSTHHGIFDLASTLPVPGLVVLAPRDLQELRAMVQWSATYDAPCAIRYGRQSVDLSDKYPYEKFRLGHWEMLEDGRHGSILAVGSMVEHAIAVQRLLKKQGVFLKVINCSTIKPLDEDMLRALSDLPMITMEEHLLAGGFGAFVASFCIEEELPVPVLSIGIPDMYVQHGRRDQLLKFLGMQPKELTGRILAALRSERENHREG